MRFTTRFVSIVIVFVIVFCSFVFFSYADGYDVSNSLITLKWRYEASSGISGWRTDSIMSGSMLDVSYPNLHLKEFQFARVDDRPFILCFRLTGFNPSDTYNETPLGQFSGDSVANPVIEPSFSFNSYISQAIFRYRYSSVFPVDNHFSANSIWFYFKIVPSDLSQVNTLILTLSNDLVVSLTNSNYFRPVFDNITYFSSYAAEFDRIDNLLEVGFNSVSSDLDSIISYCRSISSDTTSINNKLSQLVPAWYLSYDSEGVGTSEFNSSDPLSALSNSFASLGRYFDHHIQIENKAFESGAMDALDNSYDNVGSGFGDLDLGFDSLGSWSDDPFSGEAAQNSILDWFSQATANDLNNTGSRDIHGNYSDYYSSNLQDIYDLLGDYNDSASN